MKMIFPSKIHTKKVGTFTINHHPGGHEALFEDDFPIENGDMSLLS